MQDRSLVQELLDVLDSFRPVESQAAAIVREVEARLVARRSALASEPPLCICGHSLREHMLGGGYCAHPSSEGHHCDEYRAHA